MKDPGKQSEEPGVKRQLRELVKSISTYIDHASEDQQRSLLDLLADRQLSDLLEKSPHAERRRHPRKPCSLVVGCSTQGRAFKGLVKNISLGGMFILCIETDRQFSVGQQITVSVPSLSKEQETIELQGKIVWSVPDGIGVGVEITTGAKDLEALLAAL